MIFEQRCVFLGVWVCVGKDTIGNNWPEINSFALQDNGAQIHTTAQTRWGCSSVCISIDRPQLIRKNNGSSPSCCWMWGLRMCNAFSQRCGWSTIRLHKGTLNTHSGIRAPARAGLAHGQPPRLSGIWDPLRNSSEKGGHIPHPFTASCCSCSPCTQPPAPPPSPNAQAGRQLEPKV